MKKWQKILGCVVFSGMAIYELLIWLNTYVDLKYIIELLDGVCMTEKAI